MIVDNHDIQPWVVEARLWNKLFDNHMIDDSAQQALYMLADEGSFGKSEASQIMSVIQSQRMGEIDDPSGYLHTAVWIARSKMTAAGYQFTQSSSSKG